MNMLIEGFLEYAGLAVVLCWLPIVLIVRQAAVKDAVVHSILLAAAALALVVCMTSLRLIRPEYPLTGIFISLLCLRVYRWGKEWQVRTQLFGKQLALSPTLYPQSPQLRDAILVAVTLINAWLVLVWRQLLTMNMLPSVIPLYYRLWFGAGALVATLVWFALGSWGSYQLGRYLKTRLKFPNRLVGGLLRALAAASMLTTLCLIARSIMTIWY